MEKKSISRCTERAIPWEQKRRKKNKEAFLAFSSTISFSTGIDLMLYEHWFGEEKKKRKKAADDKALDRDPLE